MQQYSFAQEMDDLRDEKQLNRRSKLANFKCLLDETMILRAATRIQTGPWEARHLIVLDGAHPWALSWAKKMHDESHHLAERAFFFHIKEKYFVFKWRSLAKQAIRSCEQCRIARARRGKAPMGMLPEFRTEKCIPFSTVGIDFFGPMLNNKGSKRYGLLVTCAVTRGVHVELVNSESTGSVYEGLRRVFARRGRPRLIYSDNGRSFVRIAKDLKLLFARLSELASTNQKLQMIEWRFSTPFAPWQGGFFERMVGLVKQAMTKLAKSHKLPDNELITLLAESEALVNSRPIAIANDGLALTPACFWMGRSPISLPPLGNKECEELPSTLAAYATCQRALNGFWTNWSQIYMTSLRDRMQSNEREVPIRIGMDVLVIEPNAKRSEWEVGKVVDCIEKKTGRGPVRNFIVDCNGIKRQRALQNLAPLELAN